MLLQLSFEDAIKTKHMINRSKSKLSHLWKLLTKVGCVWVKIVAEFKQVQVPSSVISIILRIYIYFVNFESLLRVIIIVFLSFSPSFFLLSCLLCSISFSSLLFFHLKPAECIFWIDGIFAFKFFQCLILPHCHLGNHVQMKGEPFWPFALPFLLFLLRGFNGWLKGVLGSLNLVLASVPPRDKVCSQANFHMKAAEIFSPILEFQAASWAPASLTQSFCPTFPHPHPESPPTPLSLATGVPILPAHYCGTERASVSSTDNNSASCFLEADGVRKGFVY